MFCATQHVDEGLEQVGVEVMVVSFGKLQHPPRSSELLFEGTMKAYYGSLAPRCHLDAATAVPAGLLSLFKPT